jgi:glycine/D-amino acid oxidase-like deaminating enzyme
MKIAIIGAGFLGLAVAETLSHLQGHSIHVFDKKGPGGGASGIAAGLLHPFVGKKSTLNWNGFAAYQEAVKLLEVATISLGQEVAKKTGIFRPACTEEQRELFLKASQTHPECIFQTVSHPDLLDLPGIFIPLGIQVNCPLYLEGLAKVCSDKGVTFTIAEITSVQELTEFDLTIFTLGSEFNTISDLEYPPIHIVKGQLLELSYDGVLPCAISSQSYIAQVTQGVIVAGATYEHSWKTPLADLGSCEEEIRGKVKQFSPTLAALPLKSCKAGFRAGARDRKPFIKQTGPTTWCLGGLGSKGLLYHAWLAKLFASEVEL